MKTVTFYTLGCKVNQYETQLMRENFKRCGFREAGAGRQASVCVINTCTVTAAADRKSRYFVHLAHRRSPKARIVVTGCYARRNAHELRRMHAVTDVLAPADKSSIVSALGYRGRPITGISGFAGHCRAFVKVQDGCNNACSYCKVPLVRGPSRSRPSDELLSEATRLVRNGFKEIVLCGICLGAYGRDLAGHMSLVALLQRLEDIKGLSRIRLSSIEAADVTGPLVRLMANSGKICRHLHIPMQSGDDAVLRMMHRRYSRKRYLGLAQLLKKNIPAIAITTDIMVGFPGEREASFRNTLSLLEKVGPSRVHAFAYSKRTGTVAAGLKQELSPEEIEERMVRLRAVADRAALEYKERFLAKIAEVLIEERPQQDLRCWQGLTDTYITVRVRSDKDLKNRMVRLRLNGIEGDLVRADFC